MDTWTITQLLRWVHVGAASAWMGEVVVVVFVLVPVVKHSTPERRGWFLATVFPRIFRLASILSLTAVTAGAAVYLGFNRWNLNLDTLFTTARGRSLLVGGVLGLALMLFHFVAEGRLEPVVKAAGAGEHDDDAIVRRLTLIPRVGLGILVVVFGTMMYATRAF